MRSLITLIKNTYSMDGPGERRAVIKNAASLSILQIVTYLLPVAIVPYLFRVLGSEKFGLIAFAQALTQYFLILTDYGFSISATKEISLCRNEPAKVSKTFSAVVTVKLGLVLLGFLALGMIVYFIPRFRNDWEVYIFSFGAVAASALFPAWFFQGKEEMHYIARLNSMAGIFLALFIFLLVKGPRDYLLVPLLNSCALLVSGLLGLYLVFRKFRVAFVFPGYADIRKQLKAGWNVFISIAAINAYTATPVFILGLLTNNNITGFYSIAERIAKACQTFPLDSFSQAIFPRLSKIFQTDKLKALKIMQRIQLITMLICLLLLPLIFILAKTIVKVACGNPYAQAVLALRVLLIAVFFVAANAFRVQFLLVSGKTGTYSRIHVAMGIIGLPLIFLLTKIFSYAGAAWAAVAIEAGIFGITYFAVKKLSLSLQKH